MLRKETVIKMTGKLKAELECKQVSMMKKDSEIFKIISHFYRKRRIQLEKLIFKETELEKLRVSRTKIDVVKGSNNLRQKKNLIC